MHLFLTDLGPRTATGYVRSLPPTATQPISTLPELLTPQHPLDVCVLVALPVALTAMQPTLIEKKYAYEQAPPVALEAFPVPLAATQATRKAPAIACPQEFAPPAFEASPVPLSATQPSAVVE